MAKAACIAPSYAVKILRTLVEAGWVGRTDRFYCLTRPRALLDSWANAAAFEVGRAHRRFVVAGDTLEVESRFVEAANQARARYALTLFSGARRRAPFVRYPVSHAYFEGNADRVAREIHGLPVSEGGNLVLVEPDDDGVFLALQDSNGARVVSDARLYVDLMGFEARGREQAEFLLETVMPDLRERESVAVRSGLLSATMTLDSADRAMLQSRWADAVALLERTLAAVESLPAGSATRESQRARLLLWVCLAHVAFDRRDRTALEKIRGVCLTEAEVESLRRQVGYNATHVGLALLAYYSALALLADDETEKRVYAEKARRQFDVITSPYAESHEEVAQRAREIRDGTTGGRDRP